MRAVVALSSLQWHVEWSLRRALLFDVGFTALETLLAACMLYPFLQVGGDAQLSAQAYLYVGVGSALIFCSPLSRVPPFATGVHSGRHVSHLIRPVPLYLQFWVPELAAALLRAVIVFPVVCTAAMIWAGIAASSLVWFVASAVLGLVLAASLSVLFYQLIALTARDTAPRAVLQGINSLLSGKLVPLFLWPAWLDWVRWNPFAFVHNAPLDVLQGRAAGVDVVALQAVACVGVVAAGALTSEPLFRRAGSVGG